MNFEMADSKWWTRDVEISSFNSHAEFLSFKISEENGTTNIIYKFVIKNGGFEMVDYRSRKPFF